VAKSKKERRSSIRHMGASEDVLSVLAALEAAEQVDRDARPSPEADGDGDDEVEPLKE
jgi:hypothetical protein